MNPEIIKALVADTFGPDYILQQSGVGWLFGMKGETLKQMSSAQVINACAELQAEIDTEYVNDGQIEASRAIETAIADNLETAGELMGHLRAEANPVTIRGILSELAGLATARTQLETMRTILASVRS